MSIRSEFRRLHYLYKTGAPLAVFNSYFATIRVKRELRNYSKDQEEFSNFTKQLNFSNDWFSGCIPYWMSAFRKHNLLGRALHMLEIGSWEGMSGCFMLKTFPDARLTCVDTWQGSDENQGTENFAGVERNFDRNTAPFCERLSKFKGTSLSFFNSCPPVEQFDLIYVDGSHRCDDVMVDAVKSFELLKANGLLIFDDYLWRQYRRELDNPAAAINAFLRLKAGRIEIVHLYYQVIIRKLAVPDVAPVNSGH